MVVDRNALPEKKIGVEHEAKFSTLDELRWEYLAKEELPYALEVTSSIVVHQSTIYFDTVDRKLLSTGTTLGLIVNPGVLADIAWLICKQTIDWTGPVRSALEVATRTDPTCIRATLVHPQAPLPLARAREQIGDPHVLLVPQLVAVQRRQKRLVRIHDGHTLGTSLDITWFSLPSQPDQDLAVRWFELEVNTSDPECLNALQRLAGHYIAELQLTPVYTTKYAAGIQALSYGLTSE